MPLDIFIIRVSAACLVLADDRNEHGGADEVLAHLGDLAAEIRDRAAELHHVGGVGRIAGRDRVLAQRFEFVLAPVERDLTGGDLDLQAVQALSDRDRLLVEMADGHGQVGLGLAGLGLLPGPSGRGTSCGFPEIP